MTPAWSVSNSCHWIRAPWSTSILAIARPRSTGTTSSRVPWRSHIGVSGISWARTEGSGRPVVGQVSSWPVAIPTYPAGRHSPLRTRPRPAVPPSDQPASTRRSGSPPNSEALCPTNSNEARSASFPPSSALERQSGTTTTSPRAAAAWASGSSTRRSSGPRPCHNRTTGSPDISTCRRCTSRACSGQYEIPRNVLTASSTSKVFQP